MIAVVDTKIQARVDEDVAVWLNERSERMHTGSASLQAKVELGMWHSALAAELRRIRLTVPQANCLADILNGSLITPGVAGNVPVVYMEASDAFHLARETPLPGEVPYGEKWGIDEQALLKYLKLLGPTADHALHDAVSRWWETNAEATQDGWKSVGLATVPATESADGDQDAEPA